MMGKYKYLLKNMGLLTLSNFATKLLSFFLVPLYTSILTTSEYGTYDLFNTTVTLLVPLLTMDIQESVLRFCLDKDTNKEDVYVIGMRYTFLSVLIVISISLMNWFFQILPLLNKYLGVFILLYLFSALNGLLTYYARGIANIKELSLSSVLSSATTIFLNVVFLVYFKLGLIGYFLATIIGVGIQNIYLIYKLNLYKISFSVYERSNELSKKMVEYSSPMIANAVSWWVNNASDRYIVTLMCGISANGIYSVSYKIPSIISILQSIFSQAWTISAVKELDKDDSSNFYINTYNLYNFMLVITCSILIAFDKIVAKFLFSNDFFTAWKYAPFLMISTVFAGLSAFIGGLLSALKKSRSFASTSIITAIVNTIGNVILCYYIGVIGAAVSTLISYVLMWLLRCHIVAKDIKLRINYKRDIFCYSLLIIQAILIEFSKIMFSFYQLFFIFSICLVFIKEIRLVIRKLIYK